MELAKRLYPFEHRYRLGVAYYYAAVRWKGSRDEAIAAIKDALDTDPFTFDLRRDLAGLYYEEKDMEGVKEEMAVLHYFLPRVQLSLIVNANPTNN
jgi:hypothetical protein